ncbi:Panacea domain-containing protein [Methylomonas rivi]|uniref:DUF4065 domain-containing protein n=1 Tax=Methylomonas rivi TaxID=2952226 RepID=A0ABT1U6D3_9GAMM|nr:type II toxin-antitoxin system antitoxin SocA domain-containing protein [Methylomonas sp. WSC-6]MBS4050385.1 SocA family protein [Methylomonas sp.]MCQ8129422.1 DUF4065 domain-containing protein [Methylomonas sp. WSC-6]
MTYQTKAIANKFIDLAKEGGSPLSPMKLQKLVYFAHGWFLSLSKGQPLIDEKIEAWRYGPVVPSLYHEFKSLGSKTIRDYATDMDKDFEIVTPHLPDDESLSAFIKKIWEVYGKYDGIQLSNITHKPDTPWAKVWGENGVPKNTDIPDSDIKEYFDKIRDSQSVT